MQRRILALLALVLFLCGIGLFFYSLAIRSNAYTYYALMLAAPGALMAFLAWLGDKHAREDGLIKSEENEHER